jgi:hypothetical protein
MQIQVPSDLGSDLKILPEGMADATISDLFLGTSAAGQPKLTVKYLISSQMNTKGQTYIDDEGDEQPFPKDFNTVGEVVLETFSLQPQALFNLNSLWKGVTGNNLPQGDYSPDEFISLLKEELKGRDFKLSLEHGRTNRGVIQTQVKKRTFVG